MDDIPDYKKEFEEAMTHLETMCEAVSWLGGDAYEMDCVGNMTEGVYKFMDKHTPKPEPKEEVVDHRLGKYCLRKNMERFVYAVSKRNAKNILGVKLKEVICTKPPQTI